MFALHATDPATVFLEHWARMEEGAASVGVIEKALYEERTIVRMLAMRRTMFVVPVELVSLVHAAASRAVAARERRRLVQMLERAAITDDGAAWLAPVEEATLRVLTDRGEALAGELSDEVPELGVQIAVNQDKKYAAAIGVSTRVLFLLAADGHIARGRPRRSWISTQHRWAPIAAWLPEGLDDRPTADAQVELVRRWLRVFGPATLNDIKWWTGWTMGETRRAVAGLDTVEVEVEVDVAGSGGGRSAGLVLADDVEPVDRREPWVALLPALDATPMGWAERDWYLGQHREPLFDRSGNIGPTIWADGRIVGGWGQRRSDGDIALRLLDDVGAEATAAVEVEAHRLGAWLAGVRFTPRFPTPLQRELADG